MEHRPSRRGTPTPSRTRRWAATAGIVTLALSGVAQVGAGAAAADEADADQDYATLQNFIDPDPLDGEDGLPTSPAATADLGGINLVMDVDGNAVTATRENDIRFFEGKYYLYGTSQACGTFDYTQGVDMSPMIGTDPASMYRYCGIVTYESTDLMNWKLVDTFFPQDESGKILGAKKPRVAYSAATDSYVMWVHDKGSEHTDGSARMKIMTGESPVGPWSAPTEPEHSIEVDENDLFPDFSFNEGLDGTMWMVTSHGSFTGASDAVNLWRLNPERTGVELKSVVSVADAEIFGGIGISYHDGWWYITGTKICPNCVAATFSYVMARDPLGDWISPVDGSTQQPITAARLSDTSADSQHVGAVMVPDANGDMHTLIPAARYRSNPVTAPTTRTGQHGEDNLALAGLFLNPLRYDSDGKILPMEYPASFEFPLAAGLEAGPVPAAYQAHRAITATSSISQSWQVQGERIASVRPSVFQRVPDPATGKNVVNDPLLDAPLTATLSLPGGIEYTWTIDPVNVSWAPSVLPLNLPEPFTGSGEATLTLSTEATNGGYGVAAGPDLLPGGEYSVIEAGYAKAYPDAGMYLTTSDQAASAPVIVTQPRSLVVEEGAEAGFWVEAEGLGVGYQWQRDGEDVTSPSGKREATAPSLRFEDVTRDDAGVYTVVVTNPVGEVTSRKVTLTVLDAAGEGVPVEATVEEGAEGSLTMSVAEFGEGVVLEGAGVVGDRLRFTGELPGVTVTDSRNASQAAGGGWAVSGQSSSFSSGEAELGAGHLGWSPSVESPREGVSAGGEVATVLGGGEGLAVPSVLASAGSQGRFGSTLLGAGLVLEAPVDADPGTYRGVVSVSLFPVD